MSEDSNRFISMAEIGSQIPQRGWDRFSSIDEAVGTLKSDVFVQCLLSAIVENLNSISPESEFAAARSNRRYFKTVLRMVEERFEVLMTAAESKHGPCPERLRRLIRRQFRHRYPPRDSLERREWDHGPRWEPNSIEEWEEELALDRLPDLWRLQYLEGFGKKSEAEYKLWMKRKQPKRKS